MLDATHDVDAAQEHLAGARVVADVVRLAGAVGEEGEPVGPSPEDVTLVFKPASGLIVGRFADPSGQTTQMKGVILRKQGVGSGLFQGTNRPGSFFLGPSERYPIVR